MVVFGYQAGSDLVSLYKLEFHHVLEQLESQVCHYQMFTLML